MTQLELLESFYGQQIADLYRGQPWRGNGLLMGCPVWGKQYLDRLEAYCLPSIMEQRNYNALYGRCRVVFFTDPPSYARLCHFVEGMETIGFDLDIRIISQELMQVHKDNDPLIKYWILGVCQNTMIQMAKRSGMAFHQLHPDHVYEAGYYENLFRIANDHEGIAQTGISANIAGAGPELLRHVQKGGSLAITGLELGDIGFRHMHEQTRATIMNNATYPSDLPESHLWTWIGRDKIYLSCCHMNMAYMSAKQCGIASSRIPATIDAELPHFMDTARTYFPKAEDGMSFIELSDDTKASNPKRVAFLDFAKHCWIKTRFSRAWQPYVEQLCELPIKPQAEFQDEGLIRREHRRLVDHLLAIRGPDTIATEFIESLAFQ